MNAAATIVTPQQALAKLLRDTRWLNRWAVAVTALALVLIVAALSVWLVRRPMLGMREVVVHGTLRHNHLPALHSHVLPTLGGGFFTVNLAQARDAVQALPWVRRAVVRRLWPNKLAIDIEEHQPAALWQSAAGDDDRLVNRQGEIFDANLGEVDDADLPRLSGPPERSADMLRLYEQLAPLTAGRLGEQLVRLKLTERGSWHVWLDSGAQIEMGRGTEPEILARASRFLGSVTAVSHQRQARWRRADLRYPGGYALSLVATGAATQGERDQSNPAME